MLPCVGRAALNPAALERAQTLRLELHPAGDCVSMPVAGDQWWWTPHKAEPTASSVLTLFVTLRADRGRGWCWTPHKVEPSASSVHTGCVTLRANRRWLVVLDAAKSCATSPPDLSCHPADFVVMSYYKVRKAW